MIGAIAIFVVGEVLALFVFALVRQLLAREFTIERRMLEIFKGLLERLVITVGLSTGFPQILIMFGALKLGNRLAHEGGDSDEMRNYFLIGNLVSVLLCFLYVRLAATQGEMIGTWLRGLVI